MIAQIERLNIIQKAPLWKRRVRMSNILCKSARGFSEDLFYGFKLDLVYLKKRFLIKTSFQPVSPKLWKILFRYWSQHTDLKIGHVLQSTNHLHR